MLHSGSCLCGTVRFEIEGDFQRFFLCHCSRCRKGTGSAHAANLFSTSATLRFLSGEDKVKTHQIPDARHSRTFCTECGAAVPLLIAASGRLKVPAGCLDTDVPIRPDSHIFGDSRANWDDDLESVPTLPGSPG